MRILQTLYDAGGGVPPQLAVTRRLVERGHQVRVLAHETLRARVEARGAQLVPLRDTLPGHDMTRPETDLVRDWEPRDPLEAGARFRDRVLFGPAHANAREVLAELEQAPADAVLLDWLLFGTALAAERAGVPAVTLVHCPYPLRTGPGPGDAFFAPGLEVMNEARHRLGLAPLDHWDEQLLRTQAVLLLTVPELDAASSHPLPPHVRYVGPAVEPQLPEWRSPWSDAPTEPLVVVSLSTTYMDQRELADRILRAVSGLPVRVLLTAGPALDLTGVAVPANAVVVPYAPHQQVLPQASLVVSHAGFGTVQAALLAGTPLVCLPSGRDQPANAARVEELGAGVVPPPGASEQQLADVIAEALDDQHLRSSARRLSAVLAAHDGTRAVVDQLEALA